MQDVVVRTDAGKLASISVAYGAFGVLFTWLGATVADDVVVAILCYVVAVVALLGIIHNIRELMHPRVLFKADSEGVTDYSKEDDIVSLPWANIERIDLKAANNEALMLDVVGFKTLDEIDGISKEQRQMLEQNDGKGYFALELSGMWVSRKRIEQAFDDISVLAARYNPSIICTGFQDSLATHSKRGRERLERQQRRREREVRERLAEEGASMGGGDGE